VPGPKTAAEALVWIQEAFTATPARYIVDPHFQKRCLQRGFSIFDAKKIASTATNCEPYDDGKPLAGGTCWRVGGTALDGMEAKLGVEAFRDHLGRQVIVITIMDA
jgi:hypothetical protein